MSAKRLEVGDESIELGVSDFIRIKCRHRSEPISDLRANGKGRQRLIIEGRTESRLSAWVTLMTIHHEHLSAFQDFE